ncbi:copper-binding protein, partial [Acinetobacter baumannii]|uniref:copper-binding protein n=1 Tax=Acinetobacter baumannii TaxID=470 RepID=UPI0018E0726A
LALPACDRSQAPAARDAAANGGQTAGENEVHAAQGNVTAIAGSQVTIAHGPVTSIGWPAMTMAFEASPAQLRGIEVGDAVRFAFREADGTYRLTSLAKSQ